MITEIMNGVVIFSILLFLYFEHILNAKLKSTWSYDYSYDLFIIYTKMKLS